MTKKNNMLSVIIPTLNEEDGIAKTINAIPDQIRKESEIIVTDVSDDRTPEIAKSLGATVFKEQRLGKGWQMRQAVKKCKGDVVIFMDGDGTDPGQFIPQMLQALESADLVLGCRSLAQTKDPKMRRYFQLWNVISYPATHMLGLKVSDPLAGFRAIRKKDWEKLDLQSDGFEIETEMNIKAIKNKFVIKEVLIPNIARVGGLSTSKFGRSPKMWYNIIKMLWDYKSKE